MSDIIPYAGNQRNMVVNLDTADLKEELRREKERYQLAELKNKSEVAERAKRVEKTRGKRENYLAYKIKVVQRSEVHIKYYFSAVEDNTNLLLFRCLNTLPIDGHQLLSMQERGDASLFHRKHVSEIMRNGVTSGNEDEELNGRLFGSTIDTPVDNGKLTVFYCIALQNSDGSIGLVDGEHHTLEKYSRASVEEFEQKKLLSKARTQQVKKECEALTNDQQEQFLVDFENQLEAIMQKEVYNKKAIEDMGNNYLTKLDQMPLDEEQKEVLVYAIEESIHRKLAE